MPKYFNRGFEIEDRMIAAINGKKLQDLNNNLKFTIKRMFTNIDEQKPFFAKKCEPFGKPDIEISHNDETHYVSIKSGRSKEFHSENVTKFVGFLKEHDIGEKTINAILHYHFGDGTTDGSREKRMDYYDAMSTFKAEIEAANISLNKNKGLILDMLDRVIFQGNYTDLPAADFVYKGDDEMGVLCSRNQIRKHAMRKSFTFYKTPHIGPMLIRPYARYVNGNGKYPEKRFIICFDWAELDRDMDYISERYGD